MRKLSATLIGIIAAITAHAGTQNVAIVTEDLDDVLVEHVAYSPLTINATYDIDVSAGGTLVIVDTDGTIIVSTVATAITANTLQAIMPAGYWAFDLKKITRYYGDMRVTGYGNPLPWLAIDVRPAYNTGSEASLQPIIANYYTNAIVVPQTVQLDFGAGFESVYTPTNQRLSVAVSGTNLAAHTNLTLALGAHGGELDPVWAAVSNLYAKLAADQTFTGTNTFTAARTIVAVLETLGGTLIGQNVAAFGDVFIGGSVQSGGSGGLRRGSGDGIVLESLVDGADIAISPTVSGDSQTGHVFIANTGGWVKLGGTDDPVSLLDVEGTITTTEPISGVNAVAATDLATLGQSAWLITHEGLSGTTPEISGDASSYTITTTAATTFDLASGYTHGRDLVLTVYGTNSLTFPVEWSVLNPADLTGTNVFGTVYQDGTSYNVIQWSK